LQDSAKCDILVEYMAKNKGGRPIEFTEDVVKKLEEAFAIDASISEACFYANITRQSYYNNVKPETELFDRFEALRNKPILKARQTVVKGLEEPEHAKWYLARKKKLEFSERTEHTGAEGRDLFKPTDEERAIVEKALSND
jgi:predicted DNA-binding protein YlxM (UPF0122 family)